MSDQVPFLPGTIVWIAPFYNRSGYSVGARAAVLALHNAGARIRILPGNDFEPGIDDCDLSLLRSLESTPLVPPITAIVSHLPHRTWLDLKLPEPHIRIVATTFDGCAQGNPPPPEWMEVCRQLDQVWLVTPREQKAFVDAGLPQEKPRMVWWPHPWMDNPAVPSPSPATTGPDKPFRFLAIAMFQPRRRWDTLIQAYFEEFKDNENVALYFKVNYPSWHPIAGRPGQDFHNLVDSLRRSTGSRAAVIIDEDLGTRMDIVHLMDSANVFVSTDTASTATIYEAMGRQRLVIMPEGLGLMPDCGRYVPISVDPEAKCAMTPEMLLYQPHHKGSFLPLLHVKDVRNALRNAYDMSPDDRQARIAGANECITTPLKSVSMMKEAIEAGWRHKKDIARSIQETGTPKTTPRIVWEGTQLVTHSLAHVNRELCLQLIDAGCELSLIPGKEADNISPESDPRFAKIVQRTRIELSGKTDVHVRHHWPPNFSPPPEGHLVMVQPWEYGRLPVDWIEPMTNMVDEIWAYSRHILKTCIASGVPADRVQVVPLGVNSGRFNPSACKYRINSEKEFKFLFVGVAIWRKGIDLLLDAYRNTFDSRDDVALVIKDLKAGVFYLDQGAGKIIREIQRDPNSPEIVHIEESLGPQEIPGLYTACDCLVHPYRAEGFALPVLEAMACGIPVITTEGGSTDDFCSPQDVFLIPAERVEFNPSDIKLVSGAGWVLQPDLGALCSLMREAYENREAAKDRALRLSETIRSQYDWKVVAGKVMARFDALKEKPIKRHNGAYR